MLLFSTSVLDVIVTENDRYAQECLGESYTDTYDIEETWSIYEIHDPNRACKATVNLQLLEKRRGV